MTKYKNLKNVALNLSICIFCNSFLFFPKFLIKINFENESLSQLSLEERRKRALVHAGTEKKAHLWGAREGDYCENASEEPHREEKMQWEKLEQRTAVSFHQEIFFWDLVFPQIGGFLDSVNKGQTPLCPLCRISSVFVCSEWR